MRKRMIFELTLLFMLVTCSDGGNGNGDYVATSGRPHILESRYHRFARTCGP